jgi:hypothetical protein
MSKSGISKLEAARRQLDTSIELWFRGGDGLSAFTLAYASLKLLQNLYAHQRKDGFDQALDQLSRGSGAHNSMAQIANFLKHADRDPDDALSFFHPDLTVTVIGLATLLYKRLTDCLSINMQAFDSWTEITAADELGIPELDQNAERAQANQRVRQALREVSREKYMRSALRYYEFFLANKDRLAAALDEALLHGKTLQEFLESHFKGEGGMSYAKSQD